MTNWEKLLARIKSVAPSARGKGTGTAMVTITILIKGSEPIAWTNPRVTNIEPSTCDVAALFQALSGRDLDTPS
jgi:hypothetical protein